MTKATSDTHFGHYNIIKFCKQTRSRFVESLGDIDEIMKFVDDENNAKESRYAMKKQITDLMTNAMIREWNDSVSKNDTVIHTGDFAFVKDDELVRILEQLNGKIILVRGNHDHDSTCEIFTRMGHEVHHMYETRHSNKKVVFCHYPMLSWNGKYHGSIHVHGHSHGAVWPIHNNRAIDAGVDSTGKVVVSLDYLVNQVINNPIGEDNG